MMRAIRIFMTAILLMAAWPSFVASDSRPYFERGNIFPVVTSIDFDGNDVLLNAEHRLPRSDFGAAVHWPFDHIENQWQEPEQEPCAPMPDGYTDLSAYRDSTVLACANDLRVVAAEAYCPEGVGAMGGLVLFKGEHKVSEFSDALPKCHSPSDAVIAADEIWVATVRPIEKYAPIEGSLLKISRSNGETEQHLAGRVVRTVALSPVDGSIWAASDAGLHRRDSETGEWQHRYFDFRVDGSNGVEAFLASGRLSDDEYFMWEALLEYPIQDRTGFIDAWHASKPEVEWYLDGMSPALWPFYREALIATLEMPEKRRWKFGALLSLLMDAEGVADARKHALSHKLLQRDGLRLKRRWNVLRQMDESGIAEPAQARELSFYQRLYEAYRDDSSDEFRQVCHDIDSDPEFAQAADRFGDSSGRYGEWLARCADAGDQPDRRQARPRSRGEMKVITGCMKMVPEPGMSKVQMNEAIRRSLENGGVEVPKGFREVPCDQPAGSGNNH